MVSALIKKYIKIVEFVLIGLIAIVFVLIVHDNFVKPSLSTSKLAPKKQKPQDITLQQPRSRSREYYKPILANNIFGIKNVSLSDGIPKPGPDDQLAPETKLNMELIATIIDTNRAKAVLKNLDNDKANGYFVGEEVDIYKSERIKISRVDNCKVILERRSGFETIKCKTVVFKAPRTNTVKKNPR
ncbi:MAG: hypothetical protein GTN99_10620, partial [Candidatus Dadabacteria bacterium]|nr:hypothetical protein [Candidatus Dadabacteria bacterium]